MSKPNLKTTKIVAIMLMVALVASLISYQVAIRAAYVGDVSDVYVNPPFSEASYVVGQYNSTHYYAKNGTTGNYDYLSTNASQVTNYAIGNLTTNRYWKETIFMKGNFTLDSPILLVNYTFLKIDGQLTTYGNVGAIRVVGTSTAHVINVDVVGGVLYGSGTGSSNGGLLSSYADYLTVDGVTATNFGQEGFYVTNTRHSTFLRCIAKDNYFYQWFITYGAQDNMFMDCLGEESAASFGDNACWRIASRQGNTGHIERNRFIGCGSQGASAAFQDNGWYLCSRDTDALVQYNTFQSCWAANWTDTGHAGFKSNPASYNGFYDCSVYYCLHGFRFDTDVSATDLEESSNNTVQGGLVLLSGSGSQRGVSIMGADNNPIGRANNNTVIGLTIVGIGGTTTTGIYLETNSTGNEANDNHFYECVFLNLTNKVTIADAFCVNNKFRDNIGYVTENGGTATNTINGTWVSHGLAGTPTTVTLTISGSNYINSTCFILQPTVIASNSTHFQIGFYINNAGTITAVTTTNQRDIMWTTEYKP